MTTEECRNVKGGWNETGREKGKVEERKSRHPVLGLTDRSPNQ